MLSGRGYNMKYKKDNVNILKVAMLIMVCVLCVSGSSSSAGAKSKDIKTSTGYTVSRISLPNKFTNKECGFANLWIHSYAKGNKKNMVLQTSVCYLGDTDIYRTYRLTWNSKGIINIGDGMQIPGSSNVPGRFELDDKGNSYFVGVDTEEKQSTFLYICDSSGEHTKTWDLDDMIKYFSKNKNKYAGVRDYEIKKNRVYFLIDETNLKTGEIISSVQIFNVNTGKRIKVYRLSYQFERINNGYLYGITNTHYKEVYGYKYPVKKRFFKCSIDGKKCVWSHDCDKLKKSYYNYTFDVDNNKIIYLNNSGLYALDTARNSSPVLLVDNSECKVLKDYYGEITQIYTFGTSVIYIPYHNIWDQAMGDEKYVLKIKKE